MLCRYCQNSQLSGRPCHSLACRKLTCSPAAQLPLHRRGMHACTHPGSMHAQVPEPMDLPTLLATVDAKRFQTPEAFLGPQGVAGILGTMQRYWGQDPVGMRDVSAACALLDEATTLVAAKVPVQLAECCR